MKLILTSGGISNKSIENELKEFIGRDLNGLKMLFCTTASNYEGGDMNDWLIKDIIYFKDIGFKIDICDINGIDIEKFLPRFEWSDVIFFEGGDTTWLRNCINSSGLENHLEELLDNRIWIGASAGSCVLCPKIWDSCQDPFEESIKKYPIDGLGLVDFQFIPHLNNDFFSKNRQDNIENVSKNLKAINGKRLYALDDNSALFVENKNIKIVSEGKWFEI